MISLNQIFSQSQKQVVYQRMNFMKLSKSLLVILMILANLAFAQPSFADRPNFINNPDYIEVTQAIDSLSQTQVDGVIPPENQKKIDELAFQKFALETGINWGQCRNETGKILAVYGKKPNSDKNYNAQYDNGLYFLADGKSTKAKWDCDGFYLPTDAKIATLTNDGQPQELTGPVAVKIPDGSQLVIKTNPETAAIEINVPNAKIVQGTDVNWFIPNVSQALIDARVPNAPSKKS